MTKNFYVKKIITIIEAEKYLSSLKTLLDKIFVEGVQVEIYTAKELEEGTFVFSINNIGKKEPKEKGNLENIKDSEYCEYSKYAVRENGVLWITDSAKWITALELEKQAVLAYLHNENWNEQYFEVKYAMERPQELEAVYLEQIYRRYAGLPWDILETDRCKIRESTEEDVEEFFEIYSEPSIVRYMEDLYPSVEQEKQYIRDYIEKVYSFCGFGIWTVVEKATNQVIGRAGFNYREGYEEPELGFVIGVPWQQKGIAYEICNALLQYAAQELGFYKVQALVELGNFISIHLCERLGFIKQEIVWEKGKEYIRFLKNLM